jgi:hypothetical protein
MVGNPAAKKREKERQRQERAREKQAKREQRKLERSRPTPESGDGVASEPRTDGSGATDT